MTAEHACCLPLAEGCAPGVTAVCEDPGCDRQHVRGVTLGGRASWKAQTATTAPNVTPPADITRVRNAASLARTVFPGPLGNFLHRELAAWAEYAHRFDKGRQGMALADDIEARHRALVAERTFG